MRAREYRQQLAQQTQQLQWAKFRQAYPEHVWSQMTQVQQAQAWAAYQQNDRLVAASRTNWTPLWVILGVLAAIAMLYVVSRVLFY